MRLTHRNPRRFFAPTHRFICDVGSPRVRLRDLSRPDTYATRHALFTLSALVVCAGCGVGGEVGETSQSVATPEPSAGDAALPQERSPRPRGLWVLAEGSQRVLEHPERLAPLLADAGRLGTTDLFVQVYRGGRAWFDSTRADAGPYRDVADETGRDLLSELIAAAHAAGIDVHAWVNVLSLAGNRDAPLLRELGRAAVLEDRRGRSILDYPNLDVPEPDRAYYRMGTPAVWIDPAAPGVAAYLSQVFVELVDRYPDLDGLHLDYIRYPDVLPFVPGSRFGVGLDFGYGSATRERFRAETGLEAPFGDSLRNANRWDDWRRESVTALVRAIRDAARAARRAKNPRALQMSAAVWTYADRAYLSQGQDWRGWLEEDLIDFAVPMTYTLDDRVLRYHAESFAGSPHASRIWVGLGTWLFKERPARALEQIAIARDAGAAGDALFSYDAIAEAPPLREALTRTIRDGN